MAATCRANAESSVQKGYSSYAGRATATGSRTDGKPKSPARRIWELFVPTIVGDVE